MDWLVAFPQFVVNEILSVPAFLIGIITAVGLVALRKSFGQIVGGAMKATLGFLLIGAGATLVVASLDPLGAMIQGATGAQGVIPTNEAIAGIAQADYGAQVSWLMIFGFAVSLVLARFTPLHYVFLTGHHILFMATLLTIVLASADYASVIVVGLGGIILGVLMVSLPAFAHPWTRRITEDDRSRSATSAPSPTSPVGSSRARLAATAAPPKSWSSPSRCDSCETRWWPPPCRW